MGSSKETSTMKVNLILVILISMVSEKILGIPVPDNDVHFHINMPGAGKSYPLKTEVRGSKGNESGKDYTETEDSWEGEGTRNKKKTGERSKQSGVNGTDYWKNVDEDYIHRFPKKW